MLTGKVVRGLHAGLTICLLVIVTVGGALWYESSSPPDDRLYSQKRLNDNVWLYITEYQGGGATVGAVYRYYLNKPLNKPLPVLRDSGPFLVSDKSNAMITTVGDRILIRITGKIYSFSNSASFYDGNMPIMPLIDLNSTATGRYGS